MIESDLYFRLSNLEEKVKKLESEKSVLEAKLKDVAGDVESLIVIMNRLVDMFDPQEHVDLKDE